MPDHECGLCMAPATKQCLACRKVWYCSKECQREAWTLHIFKCNPTKPIKTLHYLALAVDQNLLPEHPQTCEDYGFSRTVRQEMLLGLYTGLIKYLGVKPHTVHKWRLEGTLVENIKKVFEARPEGTRGAYYPWFLENQHVLDGTAGEGEVEDIHQAQANAMSRRAWCFIGRSPTASTDEIHQYVKSAPQEEKDCFFLYASLLSDCHPGPIEMLWIKFGFCGCSCQEVEMQLSHSYIRLINRCTFEEFLAAYISGSLLLLFSAKGIQIKDPFTIDVLSLGIRRNKSVWDLKQYVEVKNIHGSEDNTILHTRSVGADYGFYNCRMPEEHKLLLDLYKEFFASSSANPLQLHEACIQGRLLAYFSQDLMFKVKPRKVYQRLLKNPYPVPPSAAAIAGMSIDAPVEIVIS